MDDTKATNRPVVNIGGHHYALLRQFRAGATSVVWQAQPVTKEYMESHPHQGYFLEELQGGELQAFLRQETDLKWEPDAENPQELVAIKIPNDAEIERLPGEARNLRLRSISDRTRCIVELKADHSRESGCPCLVLGWAQGQQLDNISEPLSERDGLLLIFQVAQLIEAIFNLRYIPLTDSVKPNSLFWDKEKRQVTVIDLGLVGENMSDLETLTLPIFGDMVHFVFAKEHVYTSGKLDNGAPIPNALGRDSKHNWQRLSIGTRRIVQNIFDKSFFPQSTAGLKGNELFAVLSKTMGQVRGAIEAQITLWDEPLEMLLKRARRAYGIEAINLFDIAWAKGRNKADSDVSVYQKEWQKLVEQWLNELPFPTRVAQLEQQYKSLQPQERDELVKTLFTDDIRYLHDQYPKNNYFRQALLFGETAFSDPHWRGEEVREVVQLLRAGDVFADEHRFTEGLEKYKQAVTILSSLKLPAALKPLLIEAQYLYVLSEAKAVLNRLPFPIYEIESVKKDIAKGKPFLAELQSRYSGEPIQGEWQREFSALEKRVLDLEKDAQERAMAIQGQLAGGAYDSTSQQIEAYQGRFDHEELGQWQRAAQCGRTVITALATIEKTTKRGEREKALHELISAWTDLHRIWPDDAPVKEFGERLQTIVDQHLRGLICLDRYAQALNWSGTLHESGISHKLQQNHSDWHDKARRYEQGIKEYETTVHNREENWQQAIKAYKDGNYASYQGANRQWREQTKKAIETLEKMLDGFNFLPSGGSLHLTQSILWHEIGHHNTAQKRAEEGQPIFEGVIMRASTGTDPDWLDSVEIEGVQRFKKQAFEWQKVLRDAITELSPDVLSYHLQQRRSMTESNADDYLVRLGLLKLDVLSNEVTTPEVEGLQQLARNQLDSPEATQRSEGEENKGENVESALRLVSLALLVDSENSGSKELFKKVRDQWLEGQKRDFDQKMEARRNTLNRDIIEALKQGIREERLVEIENNIRGALDNLRGITVQESPYVLSIGLSQSIKNAERIQDAVTLYEQQKAKPDADATPVQEEPKDIPAPATPGMDDTVVTKPPMTSVKEPDNLKPFYEQVAEILKEKVEELHQAVFNVSADNEVSTVTVYTVERWKKTLAYLQQELAEKLGVNWDGLQKRIEESKRAVQVALTLQTYTYYMNRQQYGEALKLYQQYQQMLVAFAQGME